MKKLLAVGIVAALALLFTGEQEARAQGVHLNLGRLHVDVGRPHGGHGHRSYYRGGGYSHGARHDGGWGGFHGHSAWHDTSHYDFHPGGYERHYDHYDYVPAHYDFHRQGHYDRH
jgi:hypothetical protein